MFVLLLRVQQLCSLLWSHLARGHHCGFALGFFVRLVLRFLSRLTLTLLVLLIPLILFVLLVLGLGLISLLLIPLFLLIGFLLLLVLL